jgi:hypothetical protein
MTYDKHPFGLYEGDFKTKMKAAFSDLVTVGLEAFKVYLEQVVAPQIAADAGEAVANDDEALAAATLLEVNLDASADEIRRALRRKLSVERLHPDHGGNGDRAARLIAAKNLLIERLKEEN